MASWRVAILAVVAITVAASLLYGLPIYNTLSQKQPGALVEHQEAIHAKLDKLVHLSLRHSEELRLMKEALQLQKPGAALPVREQKESGNSQRTTLDPAPKASSVQVESSLPPLRLAPPVAPVMDMEFPDDIRECRLPRGMRKVTARPSRGDPFPMVVFAQGTDIVSDQVANTGGWEMRDPHKFAEEARTTMPADSTLLDIGANLGYYTFLFANLGHRIIAVEAMTRNRAAIKASLCLNPKFRKLVTLVPIALASPEQVNGSSCVVRSTNTKINNGNGLLWCGSKYKPCSPQEGEGCEEVALKTLDQVLAEVSPAKVDVLKMDVEAFECNVMAGGETLFKKYKPKIMQIETEFCCKKPDNCVKRAARDYGYCMVHLGQNTALRKVDDPAEAGQKCH